MAQKTSVIDEICTRALTLAEEMSWLVDPLTPGRGKAYILQHIPRNRLLSGTLRPAWVSHCPDLKVVRKTIDQMREELVMDDAIAQPHTDLLWQIGRNIGLTDAQMEAARPVPLVEVAFNVWENIARTRHWIAGWLSTSVSEFILVSLPKNNFQADAWKQTFNLNNEQVLFFSYHAKADLEHGGRKVWEPIDRLVTREEDRKDVIDAAMLALTALKLFYQGVCELGDEIDRNQGKV